MDRSRSPLKAPNPIARKAAMILAALAFAIAFSGLGTSVGERYHFALNETDSLPHWAFLVDRSQTSPGRGDYFAFVAPPNPYYPTGFRFTKRVVGLPGDVVSIEGRSFFINGEPVGDAKPADKAGKLVEPAHPGVIPAGHFFLVTPHPDSLDSRYRVIGLIGTDRLVGRAYPVM